MFILLVEGTSFEFWKQNPCQQSETLKVGRFGQPELFIRRRKQSEPGEQTHSQVLEAEDGRQAQCCDEQGLEEASQVQEGQIVGQLLPAIHQVVRDLERRTEPRGGGQADF